jgi:hypothetical protein
LTSQHPSKERRLHVRVRPAPDYELKIAQVDGAIRTQLLVVDISLGGVGLLLDEITEKHKVGDTLTLHLSPPVGKAFQCQASVRHLSKQTSVVGIRLELSKEDSTTLDRVVSELLTRGNMA